MRVCKLGCHVMPSVFSQHNLKPFQTRLSNSEEQILQIKKTFPSFDLGSIDHHLFPCDLWKESKRKKNNSALHASMLVS